ncbi:hypothetical protein AgCh_001990 [Apium graveolens]
MNEPSVDYPAAFSPPYKFTSPPPPEEDNFNAKDAVGLGFAVAGFVFFIFSIVAYIYYNRKRPNDDSEAEESETDLEKGIASNVEAVDNKEPVKVKLAKNATSSANYNGRVRKERFANDARETSSLEGDMESDSQCETNHSFEGDVESDSECETYHSFEGDRESDSEDEANHNEQSKYVKFAAKSKDGPICKEKSKRGRSAGKG